MNENQHSLIERRVRIFTKSIALDSRDIYFDVEHNRATQMLVIRCNANHCDNTQREFIASELETLAQEIRANTLR